MSIQTARVLEACAALQEYRAVQDARITDRDDHVHEVLEVTFGAHVERIPPDILLELADHDCGVGPVQRQGGRLVAIVR